VIRSHAQRIVTLVSGLALAACITVGPDYEPPEVVIADEWHQALVDNMDSSAAAVEWWSSLNDPKLDELIGRAQEGNLNLAIAVARVDEAERFLGIARGDRYPDVDAVGGVSRSKSQLNLLPNVDSVDEFGDARASATWELDFWGRVRRTVESSQASYEASVEAYRDTLVLLNAQVAENYVFLRTTQERLRLANENVLRQQETVRLTEARNRAQLAPELDVQQARLNLASTEAAVPALEALVLQTINNLSVLLGEQPGDLVAEMAPPQAIPEPPSVLSTGFPADAVRNRPDVRRAERNLAAQTARIGIATSALYPNFFLTGDFGYSGVGGDYFDNNNETWSIGPVFSWNLFDGGRVRNSIGVEEARTEQALAIYEASVLEALRDTENSLVAYATEQRRLQALERSVAAAAASADLVRTLYRSGLTDFQNVLVTERTLFTQQDLSATSKGEVVQNVISVYRAIGGGWSAETP
jgi:NodT family efflux transporter outer membrane factor (OMF) lipoprotein